jgi:DNA-binding winged helix-turn-helix (wHTH) protein
MPHGREHDYYFGPYRLETQQGMLYRGDEPVPLSSKSVDMLQALVRRSGQVVSKDELMRELWPDTFVEEENLNQHIFQLRKALGETESGKPYIETVRKRGFRFSAGVGESPAAADTRKRLPRWLVAAGHSGRGAGGRLPAP